DVVALVDLEDVAAGVAVRGRAGRGAAHHRDELVTLAGLRCHPPERPVHAAPSLATGRTTAIKGGAYDVRATVGSPGGPPHGAPHAPRRFGPTACGSTSASGRATTTTSS